MVVKQSSTDFALTISSLLSAIERRGLTLMAQIDHAAGAREAGMELDDEQVILFGNARSGTPLMQSDRRIGIELPLRMLVWRDGTQVLLGYRDPRELVSGYDVASNRSTLEQMAKLLEELSDEASG